MVDQQRQRVEQEMTKMINELDKSYLRKMQVGLSAITGQIKSYKITFIGGNASMCGEML